MSNHPESRPATPPFPATRAYIARRHDGWTVRRQRDFLVALDLTRCVARAVAAVGLSPTSYYAFRKRAGGERFATACDIILAMPPEMAVAAAAFAEPFPDRVEPVFRMGKQVGTRRRPDARRLTDRLAQLDKLADRT